MRQKITFLIIRFLFSLHVPPFLNVSSLFPLFFLLTKYMPSTHCVPGTKDDAMLKTRLSPNIHRRYKKKEMHVKKMQVESNMK